MYHNLSQLIYYKRPKEKLESNSTKKHMQKRIKLYMDTMCQCAFVKHVLLKIIYKCYIHMTNNSQDLPRQSEINSFIVLFKNTDSICEYLSKDNEFQSCVGIIDDLKKTHTFAKLSNTNFIEIIYSLAP